MLDGSSTNLSARCTVLELCGSDMKEISKLELTKRSDVRYVIEEEEEDVE